jgi:L-lactate dehydrogenase complex protein LldG
MEREVFLARIAARQGPPATTGPHPAPGPREYLVAHRSLDGVDPTDPVALLPVFLDAAARVGAEAVAVSAGQVAAEVGRVVARHGVRSVVLSADPAVQALAPTLREAGVTVTDHEISPASSADLGVTGAVFGVAATGSVAISSELEGGRGAAVLPTVHLCLLPLERLRATTLDVLREVTTTPLPSNLTFVTGPSRTGDIELILTVGVHGPVAVHVLVVG